MTISMPDSIYPANLPGGCSAYLGYTDGTWPTALRLAAMFPGAHIVGLTVTGGQSVAADGIDCEPGNPNAEDAADWVARKLAVQPGSRPIAYASMEGQPGYGMPDVIAALSRLGIGRSRVRLLSAHYTGRAHICSPFTCRTSAGQPIGFAADGTQWTSEFPGADGSKIDMSLLADDFFGVSAPGTNWMETIVKQLPQVKIGATGDTVRTVQGLCVARARTIAVDGVFGRDTQAAVMHIQASARIAADGIVGPQTWPVLLDVA